MAYRSFWGNVQCEKFINSQTTKNILKFYCCKVESTRNCKLRQLSGRFQTLIWRLGETVQNQESPRLFGRVDSTAFLPSGFYRNHHCKSKSQHSILEVTFYWAAHESNAQSRNTCTFCSIEKDQMADKPPRRLCVSHSPLQWGPIFARRGRVISGHLRSSGESKIIAWSYWPYIY